MQLKRLTLTQVRGFEQAEFKFHPNLNLLVGINGAGKSTVLDALRIMLSQTLPEFTAASRRGRISFNDTDIRIGRGALTAKLHFEAVGISFEHLIHLLHEEYVIAEDREGEAQDERSNFRERHDLSPSYKNIPSQLKRNLEQPLVAYFSPHRSLFSPKASRTGGQASAFANALDDNRGLRLREFAEWWLVQQALAEESHNGSFIHRMTVLNDAITSFLDDCTNLRAVREPKTTLLIDKGDSTLDVRQLSDGERSMIALVLDLARRLTQANPNLSDPLRQGKAVVLIDELDLHLHPRWQRTICEKLTATFPACQFIATTHSPQIIGEVSPDHIILIENGKTYRPAQSLGMDTNWILRHLMGVTERDAETLQELKKIENLIEDEQYDEATAAIDVLRDKLGEFPELVGLQTRIQESSSHIEHFKPQSQCEDHEDVEYDNLLAAYPGANVRQCPYGAHIKADWYDAELLVSPLRGDCERRFRFDQSGRIKPANENDLAARETIRRLHLDHDSLTELRKQAIVEALFRKNKPLSDAQLRRIIQQYSKRNKKQQFRPFCFVIVQAAEVLLQKAERRRKRKQAIRSQARQ